MDVPAPFLISWNLTKRCDLRCAHCYLDAGELEGAQDTSLKKTKDIIGQIHALNPGAMLILTGGEPLMRPDIYDIAGCASAKGLTVVIGTNGTLLDRPSVRRLMDSGVKGAGVSLDSVNKAIHDRFRGVEGAWERTVKGIDALGAEGLDFQLQFTVTKENRADLPSILKLAMDKGARAVNVFFLVCTGRGQGMTDISPSEYESVLEYLIKAGKEFEGKMLVRARCAPHFVKTASNIDPDGALSKGFASGCIAGAGYLRISPEGFVTPCPYIPVTASTPNLKDKSLKELWETDPAFLSLRSRQLKGRCAECEFSESCGGCRARALALNKDLMAEDPWCEHVPSAGKRTAEEPVWTIQAAERLEKAPSFLRPMIKKGVEAYAKKKGLKEITPEVMAELRQKTGF